MKSKKYKRRRYGSDVVIYTTEQGHYETLQATDYPDPWKAAGEQLKKLNG